MGTFTAARFAALLALAAVAVALVLGPAGTGAAAAAPAAAIVKGTTTAAGPNDAVRTPAGPIGIVPTAAGPTEIVRAGTTPTDVVVVDRAGVLDPATLLPAVRGIEFYQPTKVAVYTYNGTASDNLNEEVLRYARAEHPDWISPDGQKWADGLFIFALDPVGRHVGTYMGEDRKVSPEARTDIQEASKDLLRDAQWTDGTIAGIRRGAELINQPWYRSAAFLIPLWIGAGLAAAGAAAWLLVRWRTRVGCRRETAKGDAAYARVSMDLPVTELNAGTIPASSRYGGTVLEKHRSFLSRYDAATALSNRVHALTRRQQGKRSALALARQFADAAAELDALDDVISDANALLNRSPLWPTAWNRQLAPLRRDLAGIEDLLRKSHSAGESATAAALRSFRDRSQADMEGWTADLAGGALGPEDALDRLRDARTELTGLLNRHAETVIEGFARTEREARLMRREMEQARTGTGGSKRPGYEPSILGTVYPSAYFFSVPAFSSGFTTGVTSLNSARGGTTGYGVGGGSFSGSGSSSGF